jgi:uncharacterized protein YndB with AHSA1/START domain
MSELKLERHYAVTPEHLFAFVTETQNLLTWWGPEGMGIEDEHLDLTRPGPWSLTLVNAHGRFPMHGSVIRVDPPRAVEFTMNVPGEPDLGLSTVRFDIAPDGAGGSRFTLTQSGITDEMVAMGQRGWGSTLSRLERALGLAG